MDENQGMADGAYLELLNKPNRSMQEENDLQAEIKRRADAEKATNPPAESAPEVQQAQPATPEQPAQPEAHVTPPVEEQPQAAPAEPEVPYDLNQLGKEVEDAVAYLETQNKTLAVEMAKSAFTQAAYWTKLASEGK